MKISKLKIWVAIILILSLGIVYFILTTESVKKSLFDTKADVLGSSRTLTFYSNIDGTVIKTYTDKEMRFEIPSTGGISAWLGSQNKKVHSNMQYIVEDNK